METYTVIYTSIIALISALGGGSVIFFRANKKLKNIEVESRQSDEWQRLYKTLLDDNRDKDTKLDALYAERQKLYERLADGEKESAMREMEYIKQSAMAEVERTKLEYARCDVDDCLKRKPPRVYNQSNQTNKSIN